MAEKSPRQSNKKKAKAAAKPDGDSEKRFPNGISATILSIQRYWHGICGGTKTDMSISQFYSETDFKEKYANTISNYPGRKKRPVTPRSIATMVNDITAGRQDIEFYKLRTFAEFTNLPSGLLLLFTQFVSKEMKALKIGAATGERIDPREVSMRHIERVKQAITALEAEIIKSPPETPLFTHADSTENNKIANVNILKIFSDAFNK